MQYRRPTDNITSAPDELVQRQLTQQQWFQDRQHDLTVSSLGEYFLPFFLAAMEVCWFNAALIGLASLGFLNSSSPLLPFWGPPLLLFPALWLFRRAQQQETKQTSTKDESTASLFAMPGLRLMFGVLAIITLLLIWQHVYSPTSFLFDPAWLLALGGDILALNTHLYQVVAIVAIAGYFVWRSMRLAQLTIEPGHVFRQLWIGLLVLLVAILLRAGHATSGGSTDDIVLILLIPIFLYVALSTHALARITFIRREHPFGLEGSVMAQERATLSVITGIGLVLGLLTVVGATLFSSAFFNSVQPLWQALSVAYNWLAGAIAQIIVWLVMPFFYLVNAWFRQGAGQIHFQKPSSPVKNTLQHLSPSSPTPSVLILAVKILLPLLILLVLFLLLRLALRRRKHLRIALNRKDSDVHENIWSWQLFWSQFKALWWSFLQRLFPQRASSEEQAQRAEEIAGPPAVRTIREIYRALLKKAAARGHARKRDETPHEFRRRLSEHELESEPQLGLLTEAYALTRYGGGVPSEYELATIRGAWNELEQKWEA